ncbi:hypothetical protein [Ancylobacter sp. FA202]|uniref:hypothetical protein n=1 Tax=Ancylobacter sp. FA202 TaxID=1111106 RepID=UPI00035D6233|nr:hypothetical protein [Ancylobacter sp. FA202]
MSEDTVTPLWTLTRVNQIDGENLSLTLDGEVTPKVEITPEGKATFNTSMTVAGAMVMQGPATAEAGLTVSGSASATGTIAAEQGFVGMGAVPVGAILMWSGDPKKLPAGWYLCNGGGWLANGDPIPDLRSQFIVGQDSRSNEYKLAGRRGGSPQGSKVKVLPNAQAGAADFPLRWYALAYIIFGGRGANILADPNMRADLRNDQFINEGEGISSPSGRYVLKIATGRKLQLLDMRGNAGATPLWRIMLGGFEREGSKAVMQADGNFVFYNKDTEPVFASDTNNQGVLLRVTDDGKVRVDDADGKPVWSKP